MVVRSTKRIRQLVLVLLVWAGSGTPAFAQWYRTYDEAVQAVDGDWTKAEEKLKAAKEEAKLARKEPGRSVLRYGSLREPFIPDYFLGQVYMKAAEATSDQTERRRYYGLAIDAFALARSSGQVRTQDPEYSKMASASALATQQFAVDVRASASASSSSSPPSPPRTIPADVVPNAAQSQARSEIARLVDQGDRGLADQNWEGALSAFQDAQRRLDTNPLLRPEFSTVSARIAETSFGRDVAAALEQLRGARFTQATQALERLNQMAGSVPLSTITTRALVADLPKRLAEAQVGQTLTTAETAMRERRWAAAVEAYETVRGRADGLEFLSAQARDLYAQSPSHLREAMLNSALSERRFSDALAIDGSNTAALEGQYGLATVAYEVGRWSDAVAAFDALLKYAPNYRDVSDRKAAAEMQVELGLAVQAEAGKSDSSPLSAGASGPGDIAEARRHYERVTALQATIRTAVRESPTVVKAGEIASGRLRRIDADAALATAQKQYQDGQWNESRSSVNLVLRVFPDDPSANRLLSLLRNSDLEQEIQNLTTRATEALARGDLSTASEAAKTLAQQVPGNRVASDVASRVMSLQAARRRWYQGFGIVVGFASIAPLLLISPRRRGRFYSIVGRPTSALRLFDRVLSSNPIDGDTLSRAASMASRYGIKAPLGQHFDAYLRVRPADGVVAAAAADYFWTSGARKRAGELYEHIVADVEHDLPAVAYERLAELYQTDAPNVAIAAFERARQRDPRNPGLVLLLASQYEEVERTGPEALEVYRTGCELEPASGSVRRLYARALLANGDTDAAAKEAERAVTLQPDDEAALDVLIEAYGRLSPQQLTLALSNTEALSLPPVSLLVLTESLAATTADAASQRGNIYRRTEATATDPVVRSLLRTHAHLENRELDSAASSLDESCLARRSSRLAIRALIQAHHRYLDLCDERSGDSARLARVAQLQSEGRWWQDALMTWQQVVPVPEWNRRAMTAIQDILDSLPLPEVATAYFATAGWHTRAVRQKPDGGFFEILVTPGAAVNADLATMFESTPVFCFSTVVTVDDIVALKRNVLKSFRQSDRNVAFLVASHAIRHDVHALIYAFMTEEPAITLIPIEARAVTDAIVEASSKAHLERTLHQWLGHTDIYETHNPVSNAATFFGRGHLINQLVLKISRGENFGIFGLRKIGKTSLVYRLRELSRDHLVAYVDLQGVASRRTDDVYVRLVESLVRDMRIKYPDIPIPPLRLNPRTAGDTSDIPSRFYTDVLAIRGSFETAHVSVPHVLLLLDEIELMIPYGGSPGFTGHQEFFRHIRGIYQQERFIVSGVVGATPFLCRSATWNGQHNPVFQYYDEIFLAPLDQPECDQMVQGLGELMGVRYDQESVRRVYEQTAGHPYIARQLCSRLVKSYPERPLDVRPEMVAVAIDEYLAQRGDYFAGILEGYLDDVARRIVETLAEAGDEGMSRSEILQRADDLDAGRHIADQTLGDMELVGLLNRSRERYRLCIPLFRRWLRRSWLDLE